MENTKDRLKDILADILDGTEYKIVDIGVTHGGGSPIIRVYVDSEHGITVDQCHQIGKALISSVHDRGIFPEEVALEVSSPGIERPFSEEWQFRKNIGRRVELTLRGDSQNSERIIGYLSAVSNGQITLTIPAKKKAAKEERLIPLESIVSGKVLLQW